jgi:hypothetical protein
MHALAIAASTSRRLNSKQSRKAFPAAVGPSYALRGWATARKKKHAARSLDRGCRQIRAPQHSEQCAVAAMQECSKGS